MEGHKAWAVGMTQDEFVHEFVRRNPSSDVIPDVTEWLNRADPVYRGIEPFNAEDLELETGHVRKAPQATEAEPLKYFCSGCKKEFTHHIGKFQHEKRCKVLLNKRL